MLVECYFYGQQVRLDVSLWRDTATGTANYTARLGQPSDSRGKYRWDGRIGRHGYRHLTAYLWTRHAYSVAVYATRPVLGRAVEKSGVTPPPSTFLPAGQTSGLVNSLNNASSSSSTVTWRLMS